MFLCNIALYCIRPCFYHWSHPQLGIVFALASSLHSLWSYFSTDLQQLIGHLPTWGVHLSVSYHFVFAYCSWDSQGKNSEVVCHSLLQWTTFCQTSPPWPDRFGWPHMAWLSFIDLDKAVVHVIRLASFLWLWSQSVCTLMPSLSVYHLTWVFLTLDVGYLFTAVQQRAAAAPYLGSGISPHNRCSWFWSWGISSQLLLLCAASITSWQIDGETMETVTDFILRGSKVTADGDCNHKIKGCLLLVRKAISNLDSILKSRDITMPTKVHLVKAMVFPVVMYGCKFGP